MNKFTERDSQGLLLKGAAAFCAGFTLISEAFEKSNRY